MAYDIPNLNSTVDQMMSRLPATNSNAGRSQGMADLSSIIGSFSKGEKADRSLKGDWTQNYDRLMLDAQAARERQEQDALAKLANTNYIKSGGSPYKPATLNIGGVNQTLPSFGFGPRALSDAQREGAGLLEGQMIDRLRPGGSYTPTDIDEYAKPGTMERLSSYGGAATGALGALDTITGGKSTNALTGLLAKIPGFGGSTGAATGAAGALGGLTAAQNAQGINSLGWTLGGEGTGAATGGLGAAGGVMSNVLGKAVPIAGIASGAYGLMKDRGWGGNLANGAQTGAGIGTMVMPGIGTAIGAGIGGLAGLLRGVNWSGVSDAEKEGRDIASQVRQTISTQATPGQKAEAGGDEGSLLHIMVRDNALKKGMGMEQAEMQATNAVKNLWESEKGGATAVSGAGKSLAGMLG